MESIVSYKELSKPGSRMIVYPDPQSLAQSFAGWMNNYITGTREETKKDLHVALSGGSTPTLLFKHLGSAYKNRIPWNSLHLYWSDERCVPPDHPESNYRMTHENLLKKINIPEENIHRIFGENDPGAEAERYAQLLSSNMPLHNKLPVFDLILLGMGDDGHTASIFPDRMDLLSQDKTICVARHPESGQFRITFTGKLINQARCVCFLITGNKKADILSSLWQENPSALVYPVAYIRPEGELFWFCDQAAARNLI